MFLHRWSMFQCRPIWCQIHVDYDTMAARIERHKIFGLVQFMQQQVMDSLWLILLSATSGVAGQTVIKLGVSQPGATEATTGLLSLIGMILRSPLILLGLILYGVGALAWIAVLSRMDLSLAYPFLALNFVLVALVSSVVLGETMPILRWLGILVICAGIFLVARSAN